ncbi:hypothetical protein ACFFU2_08295 [Halomonas alkalicola]|uniref:Uncharacterized protein n=1 Tax=Halomonas alkalicola TaxID=1930622 RepID=A0ABY9H5L7_9GAMM|nr:hypothetical protein [Halomonas alkalicola]WLI73436.1 hypothetical protein B6N23_00325 [Halomonas alkalicola]
MSSISLERDAVGTFILSCRCGSVEIGRGEIRWQAFEIEPRPNSLALVTCKQCQAQAQLSDPKPAIEGASC